MGKIETGLNPAHGNNKNPQYECIYLTYRDQMVYGPDKGTGLLDLGLRILPLPSSPPSFLIVSLHPHSFSTTQSYLFFPDLCVCWLLPQECPSLSSSPAGFLTLQGPWELSWSSPAPQPGFRSTLCAPEPATYLAGPRCLPRFAG